MDFRDTSTKLIMMRHRRRENFRRELQNIYRGGHTYSNIASCNQHLSKFPMSSQDFASQLHSAHSQIAILDFGSQYSHLIARRLRELNVFCELYSCLVDAETLSKNNVLGIIFSGGPNSVYDEEAPHVLVVVHFFSNTSIILY